MNQAGQGVETISPAGVLLEARNVGKSFGATRALDQASLAIRPGEAHALIGENGAGKSTLIKILAGALRPDSGQIFCQGQLYHPSSPAHARDLGIATCYQELAIAPHLTVQENIFLGQELTSAVWSRHKACEARARELLALLKQTNIPLRELAGRLPLAMQQFVEIARAIASRARLIILDEPTSTLTRADTESLFTLVRGLRGKGISFLYVSHFLEEVMELCDRYTVMRDGRTVATGAVAGTTIDELIGLMVGRKMDDLYPQVPRRPGGTALEVRGLSGPGRKPDNVSFTLRPGEILGLGGLVGSGRSELLRAIHGLRRRTHGDVILEQGGLGFVSEDRKGEGLALRLSLAENISLPALHKTSRWGWIQSRELKEQTRAAANQLSAVYRDIGQPVAALSGGNQQKIALARLVFTGARILLLDEPTRGIDVGSKAVIYRWLGEAAARGLAIILTSSYTPELLGICDRIGMMYRGRLAALGSRAQWTEEKLLLAATTGSNPLKADP